MIVVHASIPEIIVWSIIGVMWTFASVVIGVAKLQAWWQARRRR
jgi:hypothetical protein